MRSITAFDVGFFLVSLLLTVSLLALPRLPLLPMDETLVYAVESPHQNLYVTQHEDVVTLRAGSLRSRASALDLSAPYRHVVEYTGIMMLGLGYVADPEEVLVLGLGGGTVTRYLRRYYPEARITSVELDAKVVDIAREYFGLDVNERTEVVVEDARRFLLRTPQRYDLIFLDAYHGDYIPFHLLTREFLELLRDHLKDGGAAVANTWSHQKLYQRESATYKAAFGDFDSYLGRSSMNRIIVALKDGRKIPRGELGRRMEEAQRTRQFEEIHLPTLLERHYDRNLTWPAQTAILVDDFAPVNFLVQGGGR